MTDSIELHEKIEEAIQEAIRLMRDLDDEVVEQIGSLPDNATLDDVGEAASFDFACYVHENTGITVEDMQTAVAVLEDLSEDRHETDIPQFLENRRSQNGTLLIDLRKTITSMAECSLENVIFWAMDQIYEYVLENRDQTLWSTDYYVQMIDNMDVDELRKEVKQK